MNFFTLKILSITALAIIMTGCMSVKNDIEISETGQIKSITRYDLSQLDMSAPESAEVFTGFCQDTLASLKKTLSSAPKRDQIKNIHALSCNEVEPTVFEVRFNGQLTQEVFSAENQRYAFQFVNTLEAGTDESEHNETVAMLRELGITTETRIFMPTAVAASEIGNFRGNIVTFDLLDPSVQINQSYIIQTESFKTTQAVTLLPAVKNAPQVEAVRPAQKYQPAPGLSLREQVRQSLNKQKRYLPARNKDIRRYYVQRDNDDLYGPKYNHKLYQDPSYLGFRTKIHYSRSMDPYEFYSQLARPANR